MVIQLPVFFALFRVLGSSIELRSRAAIMMIVVKALKLMPKGKEIREFLNRLVLRKTLVLKEEIENGDIIGDFRLIPLPSDIPDSQHRILYAVAHAR